MAGIYIHIPFCKQACNYCDFYFTTRPARIPDFINALHTEIELKKQYLHSETPIQSIYWGGGTPSLLPEGAIQEIMSHLKSVFTIRTDAEITLEANPDDIQPEKTQAWLQAGFNRISLGIQSLSDADLKFMHRAHTAAESEIAVQHLKQSGFSNITVDFIYGIPNSDDLQWKKHLDFIHKQAISHFSAYALTVEQGTRLYAEVNRGKTVLPPEAQVIRQFEMLQDFAETTGYEPYEISNYALPGHRAIHNSSYWYQEPYLGLGPAAHSYYANTRKYNLPDLKGYIAALQLGTSPPESIEVLSPEDIVNEYIMTRLRLSEGICLQDYYARFNHKLTDRVNTHIANYSAQGYLMIENDHLRLSRNGKLMADRIASDIFMDAMPS